MTDFRKHRQQVSRNKKKKDNVCVASEIYHTSTRFYCSKWKWDLFERFLVVDFGNGKIAPPQIKSAKRSKPYLHNTLSVYEWLMTTGWQARCRKGSPEKKIISKRNNSVSSTFVTARNEKVINLHFPVSCERDIIAMRFASGSKRAFKWWSHQTFAPCQALVKRSCFYFNLSTVLFSLSKTKRIFR